MPWQESRIAFGRPAARELSRVPSTTASAPALLPRSSSTAGGVTRGPPVPVPVPVQTWVQSVDLSSRIAAAILQGLSTGPASSNEPPLKLISQMTRSQLEAALRVARLDGLVDDLFPALERLRGKSEWM